MSAIARFAYSTGTSPEASYCRNQGIVRRTHSIIAKTGVAHNNPGQNQRVHRSGNNAAIRPNISAPVAAVAVQPYQYISGARNSSEGSATSRERCRPTKTMPSVG